MDNDDQRITSYLVGDLPETEQAELERQYFGDATFVDRVIQVESQLLDAYARGQLSSEMRERVASRYVAHPDRRARLRFAEALAVELEDLDSEVVQGPAGATSRWQGASAWWHGRRGAVGFSLAAAALLLIVSAGWLYVERIRLRDEVNRLQAARATQEQHALELQQQLTTERLNGQALIAERDRLRAQPSSPSGQGSPTPSTPAIVALVLAIGGVRGPDEIRDTLRIPPGTAQVRLQLNLKQSDYPRYRIALQQVGGRQILNRQDLSAERTRSGWLLVLTAPADSFTPGDYMLTLSGVTQNGDQDEVSKSIFRVEK